MPKLCIGKGRRVTNYNSIYRARAHGSGHTVRLEHAVQLHVHSARGVCALKSSSVLAVFPLKYGFIIAQIVTNHDKLILFLVVQYKN